MHEARYLQPLALTAVLGIAHIKLTVDSIHFITQRKSIAMKTSKTEVSRTCNDNENINERN